MTPPLPSTADLGLEPEVQPVDELAREVLGDHYFHFTVAHLEVQEDMLEGRLKLKATLTRSGSGETTEIRGEGVGIVDAFFQGMMVAFADEYPSLKTLAVADFELRAGFEHAHGRRSDAEACAVLTLQNSEEATFRFSRVTPSVTRSCIRATLDALTFFLNSERAFGQLHLALKDAEDRARSDLVSRYRSQMGTLVRATSYSEVIERLRAEDKI